MWRRCWICVQSDVILESDAHRDKVFSLWFYAFVTVTNSSFLDQFNCRMTWWHDSRKNPVHAERCLTYIFAFICGLGVTRHTYVTFVLPSELFEMCSAKPPWACPGLCVSVTFLILPTPFHLHLTYWTLADTTEAQVSTSSAPILFLPSLFVLLLLNDESSCCLFLNFFLVGHISHSV